MNHLVLPFPLQHGHVFVKGSRSNPDPVDQLIAGLNERYAAVGLVAPDLSALSRSDAMQPIHTALAALTSFYYTLDFAPIDLSPAGLRFTGATYCSADVQAARRALTMLEFVQAPFGTQSFDFEYAYLPDSESRLAPYAGWATPSYNDQGWPVARWRVYSPVSVIHGQFWIGQGISSLTQWPVLLGIQEQPLLAESGMALATEDGFVILPEFTGLISDRPDLRIAHDIGSFALDGIVKPTFRYFPGSTPIKQRQPHASLAPNRAIVGGAIHLSFTSFSLLDYSVRITSPVAIHPTVYESALATGTTTFPLTTLDLTVPNLPTGIYFVEAAIKDEGQTQRLKAALAIIQP